MIKWLKYSGVWVTLVLNPYHWQIAFNYEGPNDMDPARHHAILSLGPVNMRIVIDDGSY
jgi:hypothetical protein